MGNKKNLELEWIKNNLANIQASSSQRGFQISMSELVRLYGDLVSRKELEKCVRDLERQGVLKKASSRSSHHGPETYLFMDEIKKRLSEIDKENSEVLQANRELDCNIQTVVSLHDLWVDHSDGILASGEQLNGSTTLYNFVSAYWQTKLDKLRQDSALTVAKIKEIEEEISRLKVLLE